MDGIFFPTAELRIRTCTCCSKELHTPLHYWYSVKVTPRRKFSLIKMEYRDFPGGPVAKTLYSQYRGPGYNPGQGTRSHMPQLRSSAAR